MGGVRPTTIAKYEYDGLTRLKEFRRGTLTGTDTIANVDTTQRQTFTLDPVGNWTEFKDDAGDGSTWDLDQDRTHNLVNEITDITEQTDPQQEQWATPAWDARGNMMTVPKPADLTSTLTATYDAWSRLVEVKDGETVIQKNEYDGLNRRVKKHIDTGGEAGVDTYRHFFYNNGWQILETRATDPENEEHTENTEPETLQPEYQYVWSVRYIDSPILGDKNTDDDGLCDDERIYYTTDANFNVTALVKESGESWVVVERYMYTPYGTPIVLNADWSLDSVGGDGVSDYLNNILFAGYYYDWETGLYHVRNRTYHAELGRFLQRDPLQFTDSMNLYEYTNSNPWQGSDPFGEKIRSRIDKNKCRITIILNITIYAKDKKTKKVIRWAKLKKRITDSILNEWNKGWTVNCCRVDFEVDVTPDKIHTTSWGASGDNEIEINDEKDFTDYVSSWWGDGGEWSQRSHDWAYAHEAGHLMGLPDDYHDTRGLLERLWKERRTAPDPGHAGHMMAEYWGKVAQHEVEDVLEENHIKCPCKPPEVPARDVYGVYGKHWATENYP